MANGTREISVKSQVFRGWQGMYKKKKKKVKKVCKLRNGVVSLIHN